MGDHLPFWDYAKLERDIQTRLFLKEANASGLERDGIINAIRTVNGVSKSPFTTERDPVIKLIETTEALRTAIRDKYPPEIFRGSYRVVLAYAMISVFFRTLPDEDIDLDLQYSVAAEAAIALLEDPGKALAPLNAYGQSTTHGRHYSPDRFYELVNKWIRTNHRLSVEYLRWKAEGGKRRWPGEYESLAYDEDQDFSQLRTELQHQLDPLDPKVPIFLEKLDQFRNGNSQDLTYWLNSRELILKDAIDLFLES